MAIAPPGRRLVDLRVNVAIGREEIEIAVEVEVEEAHAPPKETHRRCRQTTLCRDIHKSPIAQVFVKSIGLAIEIRHVEVRIAIAIAVARVNAHTRLHFPIAIVGYARLNRDIDKTHVGARAISIVAEKHIRRFIVGDKEVDIAIAVEVLGHHPHAEIEIGRRHARRERDVGKRSIVVAIEPVPPTLHALRTAKDPQTAQINAGILQLGILQ